MNHSSSNSSTNITEDRSVEESPKYWHESITSSIPQDELNASFVHSHLKVPVHLETIVKRSCPMKLVDVNSRVKELFTSQYLVFQNGSLPVPSSLASVVESISVVDLMVDQKISFWQAEVQVHAFRMMDDEPEAEYLEGEHGDLPLGEQLELPNTHLQGLWESIVVESSTKNMLLNYCSTSLLFAGNNVDSNLISWNKMILLHGPPGTGKTSLSKALAQKICIRNAHLFQSGLLFEVNCHSLFSKWFSESGKLVMKLFQHISDIADDEECLVVLLIDEVESIAAARNNANRSGEPGDAIRVVNAVLTSLDQLRRRKNVLVMCTSNMQSTLDEAFLDRLDLNIHVGNPSMIARQEIITTCIRELLNRQLLHDNAHSDEPVQEPFRIQRQHLLHLIAEKSEGYSGRALRKLPIKTYAKVVDHPQVSLDLFLQEMLNTVSHS